MVFASKFNQSSGQISNKFQLFYLRRGIHKGIQQLIFINLLWAFLISIFQFSPSHQFKLFSLDLIFDSTEIGKVFDYVFFFEILVTDFLEIVDMGFFIDDLI